MDTDIEELIGSNFIRKKGYQDKEREGVFTAEECGVEEIKNASFVGLLFSANWCPPCKCFLAILKDFYSEVNIDGKKCEIVYVPMDKSEEEFREHYG